MSRLPKTPMEKIDRDLKISFTWNGKPMKGLAGDTIASALHAGSEKIIGRSLKYHRPRGLYSLDGESGNTLVNVDGEANVQAELTMLREGMRVTAQNFSGSVEKDRFSFIDKMDYFMPAGFYYRRFHKPAAIWPMAVKRIRDMAGTGVVDPDKVYKTEDFTEYYPNAEVCVIGGGPAGMAAALNAADHDLRVILFEARPWLGGFYDWRHRPYSEGRPLYKRGMELAEAVLNHENIRVFTHTPVNYTNGDNLVTAIQVGNENDSFVQRYIQVRPTSVIVAAGCIERPLIFENNERPGVMQAGCALRLARTWAVSPGKKAVFSVGDDLGLEAALDLTTAGVNVLAVADARKDGHDRLLLEKIQDAGIAFLPGWAASRAEGRKWVEGAVLGDQSGSTSSFACDLLVASAGLTPLAGALASLNTKFAYDEHTGWYMPKELPPRVHAAGRMLGYSDPEAIEVSGALAGLKAAADSGRNVDTKSAEIRLSNTAGIKAGCKIVHGPGIGKGGKSFICFDEDGTYKTAAQSVDQAFDVPELAKRFGGFGLGPGQAGVPGHNLPLVLAEIKGESPETMLPTTSRSPITPTLMATLVGPGHDIFKRTPIHGEQEKTNAVFRRVGVWKRARYFSKDFSSAGEIKAVRTGVGIIDVSTLGKFRIHGPDALKALQRCYISNMSRMTEGKLKYSAMLNHDGMIVDDGVVARVGENDYYFTASTGRAGGTIEWFRYHSRYDGWDFNMINLTDSLAAINLAGPKARDVLSRLTDADISNEAFPYMGYRELKLKDEVPVRALRVGFVGELSYELHFPASYGSAVWNMLLEAGKDFGIQPFGLEAQSVLRLEKGHIIIGQESEQRVNLLDLGMGFLWDKNDKTSGKIGAPALEFTREQEGRFKLVGFEMKNTESVPGDGSVVYEGDTILGFVCTCRKSATLGKTIGMALVRERLAKPEGRLNIYQNDSNEPLRFEAAVTTMPFYDPEGERLRS